MCKKILSLILTMLLFFTLLPTLVVKADFITVDGILYSTSSDRSSVSVYMYSGSSTELVIPARVNGLPVTSITPNAFTGCTSLKKITLPYTVTSIGIEAFSGCTSLTSVAVPDGVRSIMSKTFANCTSLTDISLPDSITSVASNAFINTAYYNDDSNWTNNVLYIGSHLIKARSSISGNYEIKPGTKTIADQAFYYCTSLTGVTVPSGVIRIGDTAFYGCSMLSKVSLPDSITSIGEHAFFETSYYRDQANWENSLLYIGDHLIAADTAISGAQNIRQGTLTIADRVFYNCSKLTDIVILEGLISIGKNAFYNCSKLSSVALPKSIKIISSDAFYYCQNIKSVYYVGDKANWGNILIESGNSWLLNAIIYYNTSADDVYALNNFDFEIYSDYIKITKYIGSDAKVNIPAEIAGLPVTLIGDSAFYSAYSLREITIPENVVTIGPHAFSCCYYLEKVSIPKSTTTIAGNAFFDCISLSDVYYGGSVADWDKITIYGGNDSILDANIHYGIGDTNPPTEPEPEVPDGLAYFVNNDHIEITGFSGSSDTLVIPKRIDRLPVTVISDLAFYGSKTLKNITLPNSITSIHSAAFYNCSALTDVNIPDGVIEIGSSAFSGCTSLKDITIPKSVESIGVGAFTGCASITDFEVAASNKNYRSIDGVLFGKAGAELIQYPMGSLRTEYEMPDSVTSIAQNAFADCTRLTKVTFGESVSTIGLGAFLNCFGLRTITLPKGVKKIDMYAFSDCSALSDIYYGGSSADWERISIDNSYGGNSPLFTANIRCAISNASLDAPTLSLEGESIKVRVTGSNIPSYASLIAVGYSHDKEFIAFSCVIDGSATLPAENVKTVKIFLWVSFLNMRALCPASEAEVN